MPLYKSTQHPHFLRTVYSLTVLLSKVLLILYRDLESSLHEKNKVVKVIAVWGILGIGWGVFR